MSTLGKVAASLLALALLTATILRVRYGGGEPFPDRSTAAVMASDRVEVIAELPEPPGNIAVSKSGRIFVTLHPEAKPSFHVGELIDGKLKPFPDQASQKELFRAPQGIRVDRQNRLWTIDHADSAQGTPRLLAFDVDTGKEVHRFDFDSKLAPIGSYLQDLVVAPNGKTVYIADASFFRKAPAIVIYDLATKSARRVLEDDPSVMAQNFMISTYAGPSTRMGGLLSLKIGVDSIAIDDSGQWLYYGAMNHPDLFRVQTTHLLNASVGQIAAASQKYADKVQSDGITIDSAGTVYMTDVEHGSIAIIPPDRKLKTLFKHPKMRWPDGFSFGPDGYLYIADSAIPDIVMQSKDHVQKSAPYHLFRVKLDAQAVPGQ